MACPIAGRVRSLKAKRSTGGKPGLIARTMHFNALGMFLSPRRTCARNTSVDTLLRIAGALDVDLSKFHQVRIDDGRTLRVNQANKTRTSRIRNNVVPQAVSLHAFASKPLASLAALYQGIIVFYWPLVRYLQADALKEAEC